MSETMDSDEWRNEVIEWHLKTRKLAAERDAALAQLAEANEYLDEMGAPRTLKSDNSQTTDITLTIAGRIAHCSAGRSTAKLAEANATIARLRVGAEALVLQLNAVHEDPQYKAVWSLSHIHGHTYTGLQYRDQLDCLEATLAACPAPGKEVGHG